MNPFNYFLSLIGSLLRGRKRRAILVAGLLIGYCWGINHPNGYLAKKMNVVVEYVQEQWKDIVKKFK